MKYTEAKRLHVGDEVTIKATNEIVIITNIKQKGKYIMIDAMTRTGIRSLYHDEIIG